HDGEVGGAFTPPMNGHAVRLSLDERPPAALGQPGLGLAEEASSDLREGSDLTGPVALKPLGAVRAPELNALGGAEEAFQVAQRPAAHERHAGAARAGDAREKRPDLREGHCLRALHAERSERAVVVERERAVRRAGNALEESRQIHT